MKSLALILVIAHFFSGALSAVQSQLLGAFNIFDTGTSITDFVRSLNILVGPLRNPAYPDLKLDAKSAIILDQDSGKVLFSENPDGKLPIASITKIMTALVMLDKYQDDLDTPIKVPAAATEVTGSKMKLQVGETITVHNLLRGLLIQSANDAAMTFALEIADTPDSFVRMMNVKAEGIGLSDTHFTNPTGLDETGHHSTARDIANLTRFALNNPVFAEIVAVDKLTVKDTTGKVSHSLDNTNLLIGRYRNVIGVKTGTTEEAGESLVASVEGDSGQKVIAVLLDSPNRFQEGKKALDWALKAYSWIEAL
ncbi:MAG: D-alanyl-D-alanine carboxypeptidase family protein [bacterium]